MNKKIITTIIVILVIGVLTGGYLFIMRGKQGQEGVLQKGSESNILIVYYSYTGTTKRVAEHLQKLTNGDLYDIQPETKYSEDSNICTARLMAERASNNMPKLMGELPNISKYDLIIVGTPVWNGDFANPVMTYVQENNFEEKKVAPFWTYINDDGKTYQTCKELAKNGDILDGLPISSANRYNDTQLDNLLNNWLTKINN